MNNDDKIYVPDIVSTNCAYMQSNNVLRVYEHEPQAGQTVSYIDYFVDNHYLYRTGSTSFSAYSTFPQCIAFENTTQDFFYRTDFDSILVIFLILSIFVVYLPLKLFSRLFGRWLKL